MQLQIMHYNCKVFNLLQFFSFKHYLKLLSSPVWKFNKNFKQSSCKTKRNIKKQQKRKKIAGPASFILKHAAKSHFISILHEPPSLFQKATYNRKYPCGCNLRDEKKSDKVEVRIPWRTTCWERNWNIRSIDFAFPPLKDDPTATVRVAQVFGYCVLPVEGVYIAFLFIWAKASSSVMAGNEFTKKCNINFSKPHSFTFIQ